MISFEDYHTGEIKKIPVPRLLLKHYSEEPIRPRTLQNNLFCCSVCDERRPLSNVKGMMLIQAPYIKTIVAYHFQVCGICNIRYFKGDKNQGGGDIDNETGANGKVLSRSDH